MPDSNGVTKAVVDTVEDLAQLLWQGIDRGPILYWDNAPIDVKERYRKSVRDLIELERAIT